MSRIRMVPGVALSFVVQVVGGGLSAFTSLYLARALGPADKGSAQVLVLVPAILIVLCNLGVHVAGAWFLGRGQYELRKVLGAVFWWALIISAVTAVPLWFGREWLQVWVFRGLPMRLVLLSLGCVPLYIVAYYTADVLMASSRFVLYATLRLIPLVVYGLCALLLVGVYKWGLFGATVAFVAGISASGLFALAVIFALSRGRLPFDFAIMRHALQFGGYVHAGTVSQFLVFKVDVLIVNAIRGGTAAGLYALAASLAEVVWFIGRAVESVIVSRIARADADEAGDISGTALRITASASVLAAAAIAAIGIPLVHRVLPAYVDAISALVLLLPAAVMAGLFIVAAGDLRGRGRPELAAVVSVAGLAVNLILNFVLVPKLGFVGAAWASLTTYAIQAALAIAAVSRLSGIPYSAMFALSTRDLGVVRSITRQFR